MSVTPEQKLQLLKARAEDLMTMVDAVVAEFSEREPQQLEYDTERARFFERRG